MIKDTETWKMVKADWEAGQPDSQLVKTYSALVKPDTVRRWIRGFRSDPGRCIVCGGLIDWLDGPPETLPQAPCPNPDCRQAFLDMTICELEDRCARGVRIHRKFPHSWRLLKQGHLCFVLHKQMKYCCFWFADRQSHAEFHKIYNAEHLSLALWDRYDDIWYNRFGPKRMKVVLHNHPDARRRYRKARVKSQRHTPVCSEDMRLTQDLLFARRHLCWNLFRPPGAHARTKNWNEIFTANDSLPPDGYDRQFRT